jgi:signal transduction histidine kinase
LRQQIDLAGDRAGKRSFLVAQPVQLCALGIDLLLLGGELRLLTRDWLDEAGEPQGALLEVQDRGPGLSPQVRERLFTPFFTTKNDGNGLGLWISQGLVERYGGRLEADNRADGLGAVFRVRLLTEPRVPEASQAGTGDGRPGRLG